MPKTRMTQVAEQLLQQSRNEKVAWEVLEGKNYAYKVDYPDTTVVISSWSLLRDVAWDPISDLAKSLSLNIATYRLELQDSTGQVDEALLAVPGQAVHKVLRDVFDLAHRQASPTEENIDKILEYLKGT